MESTSSASAYVFLFMPNLEPDHSEEKYREKRKTYLENYCFLLAFKHRSLKEVIGIATEPKDVNGRSHDLLVYRPLTWNGERVAQARRIQEQMGVLRDHNLKKHHIHMDEYPGGTKDEPNKKAIVRTRPGRNDTCPCGSGQKYKKCCLTRSEI